MRTRENQEKASEKTHHAIRAFVAALLAAPLTPKEIDQHLLKIAEASRPLTKSDTLLLSRKKAAQVFREGLRLQLAEMAPEDLKRLRERAQQAPPGLPGAALRGLGREVDALGLRGDPDLQRVLTMFDSALLASANGDVATVDDQLSQAQGRAAKLLERYPLLAPGKDRIEAGGELLKEICALWMQSKTSADDPALARFFQAMPAALQASWQTVVPNRLSIDCEGVDQRLQKAIQHIDRTLRLALRDACAAAYNRPGPDTLIALANAWTALRNHSDSLKRPDAAADLEATVAMAAAQAQEALQRCDLGQDGLTHQQLHRLGQALTTLGIAQHSQAIAAETARRQKDNRALYVNALTATLRRLQKGQLDEALVCLQDADQRFGPLVLAEEELRGGRPLDLDGRTALVFELFQTVLHETSTEICAWAFATLNHPQTRLLAKALRDMGERAPGDEAMAAFGRIGTHLGLLKSALAAHLNKADEERHLSDAQAQRATELLNGETFAIAQRFTGGRVQNPQG